jgi:hypothetical protein
MGTWCKGFWYCCNDILSRCKERLTEPIFKKYLFSWDNVSGNNGDKKILQNFLRNDLTFFFRIHANFTKDLENTDISTDLRKVFNDNEHPLSNNAKILTVDVKNEWKIEDKGKAYKIKKSKFCKKLNICGPCWTGIPEIRKTPDGKTIRIFEGENLPKIDLYEQEAKATLKISDDRSIDLKVKRKDGKRNIYYVEFPHSQVWRVLATIIVVILGFLLCIKSEITNLIIIGESYDHWAICSLWGLIFYLSLILWLPFHNIWECIERVNYAKMRADLLRQKISGSLNVVSTLVAFSIAFIVLSMSIFFTTQSFSNIELNVFKLVMGLLVVGVIFLVVTLEAYDTSLIPAFDSAQIERVYLKGWWYYTLGLYSIVVALLLYVYLLEPLITIMGVLLFMVTLSIYLKTECNIKPKCNQSIKKEN